jgi:hypothetical protein
MGGRNSSSFPPIRSTEEKSEPRFVFRTSLIILVLITMLYPKQGRGQTFSLLAVTGGITGTLTGTDYINSFGTMNALGLGTPETGLTLAALTNGALYYSEFQVQFTGLAAGHNGKLTAVVTTNFAHPAAQTVESCPSTGACTTSGGYSAISTSAAAPTTVIASMGNATATVGIGVFLPDNDGATAFTGVDNSAVVTYTMTDLTTNKTVATATWTFNGTPNQTVQDAVELTLGTATGGLTITSNGATANPNYTASFGNVNGLGIGPATGLTTVAASGGTIYSTPYLLNPVYSDFTSTTATLEVYVSTNFAHSTILILEDSGASGGPYTAISTTAGTPTVMTTTAADRSQITRYLGLFVSVDNATPFNGADSATLTYTMTVP